MLRSPKAESSRLAGAAFSSGALSPLRAHPGCWQGSVSCSCGTEALGFLFALSLVRSHLPEAPVWCFPMAAPPQQ